LVNRHRGFAALLAESLWLSGEMKISCGYAAEVEPQTHRSCVRKARRFPLGERQSRQN